MTDVQHEPFTLRLPADLARPDDAPSPDGLDAEIAALTLAAPPAERIVESLHAGLVEARERWRVTDDSGAEWAGRHLAELEAQRAAIAAQAAAWRSQIDSWESEAAAPVERRTAYFSALLRDYACRQREEGRKTIRTPSVTVQTRQSDEPRVVIADADAIIEWARETHPELIHVTERVLLPELREQVKVIEEDGQRTVRHMWTGFEVPGTAIRDPEMSFSITLNA